MTWVEKTGLTNVQITGIISLIILLIGGMVLPDSVIEKWFNVGENITRETIKAEIDDYIDLGLGGSPYQTEKTADSIMGTVGNFFYNLYGESGKLRFYTVSEANMKTWTRTNVSGRMSWMTNVSQSTGYVTEADSLLNNHTVGTYVWGQAGEDLNAFDLVYLETDGDYMRTDANNTAEMHCVAMSAEKISNAGWGFFLIDGYARCDSWSPLTVGSAAPVMVGWVPGELTQTLLDSSGDQVQRIGYALASKILKFTPDSTVVEIV